MSHSPRFGLILLSLGLCSLSAPHDASAQTQTNEQNASASIRLLEPVDQTQKTMGSSPATGSRVKTVDPPGLERSFATNFIEDQATIWTSPLRIKRRDFLWLLPAAGATAGLIYSDATVYQRMRVSTGLANNTKTFSDAGVVALGAAVGGLYMLGRLKSDDHAREAGVLGAEAFVNSLAVNYALKYSLQRERPAEGQGRGQFFSGGDSSPSLHAMSAWAMASVLAHEYPTPLVRGGAYGLAAAVSLARVTGRQHFPSDVVLGGALGWAIGRQVYKRHHDNELGGVEIGTFNRAPKSESEKPGSIGSAYVPLDSWIYPAIDKLAALGFVKTNFHGLRPWTKLAVASFVDEAGEALADGDDSGNSEAWSVYKELKNEIERTVSAQGGSQIAVDSIYTRVGGIAGQPLTDGYHFGSTIINDYGRPFGEGFNAVAGLSAEASSGPFVLHVRAEYQHRPTIPALPLAARTEAANFDAIDVPPDTPSPSLNRLRLLDTYVSATFHTTEISFGKQSLWWGPSYGGAWLLSNNAEPVTMLRITQTEPFKIPALFSWMGPIRTDFFFGQLSGHEFTFNAPTRFGPGLATQPYVHGEKISFKPTPNLEFGVSRTAMFGGDGMALTTRTFFRSLFSTGNAEPGQPGDPGDRRSGFDFSYRVPYLRKWLTIYNDAFADDELSPIGYPRRSAQQIGFFVPQLPKLSKMDFRAEGGYTDLPGLRNVGFFYSNFRYLNGYTNQGNIVGNWIGRQGRGIQLWSNYWFSPRNKLQLYYRYARTNRLFLEGGRIHDIALNSEWLVKPDLQVSSSLQVENWRYPLLDASPKTNVTFSMTFRYQPAWRIKR